MGVGFEEPPLRFVFSCVEPVLPRIFHYPAYMYDSSGWASVMVSPWKAYKAHRYIPGFDISIRERDDVVLGWLLHTGKTGDESRDESPPVYFDLNPLQ